MTMRRVLPPIVMLVAITAASARAQQPSAPSLAEVARQAEAAKPTIKKATKTYTNASLGAVPQDQPAPVAQQPSTGFESKSLGKVVSAEEMIVRSEKKVESDRVTEQSEPNWRGRAASLRKQIDEMQQRLSALSISNPLTEGNPALKKDHELDVAKARQALGGLQKQWAALEVSASEAKVPSEWLDPKPAR
jgi:hypothetical protein